MRRFVRRAVREVWMRENTRRIQRDEAIPTGEVQAPPAADSSDPSTWDVETVTVHQDVEDINDGREVGIMSSNSSNNGSAAASSGPVSHGPCQPSPSSTVSDCDASDDAYCSSYSYSPISSPSSSRSSSPSSTPRSEDMVIATIESLLETDLSNCTHTEVGKVIKDLGEALINSRVILGFDFSDTRRAAQEPSSGKLNLHSLTAGQSNPTEDAVTIMEEFTRLFCKSVQCFGYGDATALDKDVFSFFHDQRHCNGIEEILRCYRNFVQRVQKGPSTSLLPIIHTAMDIVDSSGGQHHILIIFTEHSDQVEVEAVVHASFYALSIVVVGVGDGPWLEMHHSIANLPLPCDCCICQEDAIKDPVAFHCNHTLCTECLQGMYDIYGCGVHPCPQCRKPLEGYTSESSRRRFLNIHFVNFNEIMQMDLPKETKEALFVLECFKHTPTQRKHVQDLGILGSTTGKEQHSKPLGPPLGCNPDFLSWDACYQDLPGSSTLWPGLDP